MAGAAGEVQGVLEEPVDGPGPVRLCALTRTERPIEELIRFVAGPDGMIVADLGGKLPGRGVWLSCEKPVVAQAAKSGVFARSLKREVKADPGLADQVEGGLLKRTAAALAMANKAGLVTAGYAQVNVLLESGGAVALFHGSDAAEGGREKLDRKFSALCRAKGLEPKILSPLTIEQMSLAMGRANVVHAALNQGGASEKLLSEAGRLWRYRSGSASTVQPPPSDAAPGVDGHTHE